MGKLLLQGFLLCLVIAALDSSVAAQNFPLTPDWELESSVDKMTDKTICKLYSPYGYSTEGKEVVVIRLGIINDKLFLLTTNTLSLAYRNVVLRADKNSALTFSIGTGNNLIELKSPRNSPLFIKQLTSTKKILVRLAITADDVHDIEISASQFNEGYEKYKKCREK